VSASILSLPRLSQTITKIKIDFQRESIAQSISSGVDKILAAESPSELANLVSGANLSVDKPTSDMIGNISNNRIRNPALKEGYPVVESTPAEKGPLQYKFPNLKLSGGKRREGNQNRVTDDRFYLVVQFKFTFDDKEYHVIF